MFSCNHCSYNTEYKHNLTRHLKRHNVNRYNVNRYNVNHHDGEITQHEQIQNVSKGYPVQALNLSNNINTPPTTKQIINIQPPSNPCSHAKPFEREYFDIRLKENFKIFISGPSRSGKTVFIKELIKNLHVFSQKPPEIITLVYKVMQPIYHDLGVHHLIEDGVDLKKNIFEIARGRSMLLILDDCINSPQINEISDLFLVDGRHRNLSTIFISQKLFVNNDAFREISQNSDYFIIFKNPRNVAEIRNLASQMTPGKLDLVKYYNEATTLPFSYLFINLTQECNRKTKYLSNLFNIPHRVNTYFNNTKSHFC